MKVINLIGPPSCGKSTTATYVFSKLKLAGYNVEYISEYAKTIVYQNRLELLKNQIYITAKQHKMIADIRDYQKVPLVITDSPILLGKFYGQQLPYYKEYCTILDHLHSEFDNFNVYIYRNKPYNPSGRTQSEIESDAIGKWLLGNLPIDYSILGDEEGANQLAKEIKARFLK